MNWFERYSQGTPGSVAVPENGTPGNAPPEIAVTQGTQGMQVVFHGREVNDAIVENIIVPMNQISADTYKFLENAPNSEIGRFFLKLSTDGRMENFRKVVESYVNDGYVDSVQSGTADGLSSLQQWTSELYSYFNGAVPFEGVAQSLSKVIGL